MLDRFDYIKIPDVSCNLEEHLNKLFTLNCAEARYQHICSVAEKSKEIAVQYSLNSEKCYIAAMLHDIATLIKPEDMLEYARKNEWSLCEAEITKPFLLHQRMSAVVAKEDFQIVDEEVLGAIEWHTSLCENATAYQMAVFIADKLAWSIGGYPPYYEKMNDALKSSLEEACCEYMKYMQEEVKMDSVHVNWTKAVRWIADKSHKN